MLCLYIMCPFSWKLFIHHQPRQNRWHFQSLITKKGITVCGREKYNTFLTGSQPKVTHFENYNGDSEFVINVIKKKQPKWHFRLCVHSDIYLTWWNWSLRVTDIKKNNGIFSNEVFFSTTNSVAQEIIGFIFPLNVLSILLKCYILYTVQTI